MSEELSDRVHRLLTETSSALEEFPNETDEVVENLERDGLGERAAEAAELFETTDADELLAALGLTDGEEGPGSIPGAILTGDPAEVAELRALMTLSRLSPEGEEELDADTVEPAIETLRETLGGRYGDESSDAETDASSSPADAHGKQSEEASESGPDGEAIKSAMQSALSGVRNELGGVTGSESDEDSGLLGSSDEDGGLLDRDSDEEDGGLLEGVAGEGGLLDRDGDEEDSGLLDRDSDDEDEEDGDGLLGGEEGLQGSDEGLAEQEAGHSGGRAYLRTMPRQDRADMRAVRRHSTMPER